MMTSPVHDNDDPSYSPGQSQYHLPEYNVNSRQNSNLAERSSDEEGTIIGENTGFTPLNEKEDHAQDHDPHQNDYQDYQNQAHAHDQAQNDPHPFPRVRRQGSHLTATTINERGSRGISSPSQTREASSRLDDDLEMLKIERHISRIAEEREEEDATSTVGRSRSRRDDTVDEFDIATNPIHEKTAIYKPPAHPVGKFSKMIKKIHQSSFLVRYVTYITPVVLILLIPLLIGALVNPVTSASVGGVQLLWFMIWLEIVWLTLWAGRLLAKALPWPIGMVSSLFTNNSKKWRDMGKQLELPATLFFWWLGVEVSFLPTMIHHQTNGSTSSSDWMRTTNKILVSIFVGVILNFVEKIIIQLIAISFHLRTYADRIELNKFQIGSLVKLYTFSKEKITMEDSEFENPSMVGSGARTPGQYIGTAKQATKNVLRKVGDVTGKVAGDFTGRTVNKSTHPSQVVLALLSSTSGSQVLARRLYRTFAREETEAVHPEDLKNAFDNDDEADAAFSMFDKDMNGDISMEELEAVCVEIGRERKSITASLKDLDSVVAKLDDIFMFIVCIITIIVFISLISTSASGVLTSAGSSILALSWLFSATAQEFLQSCIFVFVKHPFDVGDRVTIYGNTGASMTGDDYFVKEISLLYTEFKKMEGHLVQAPNSYLNTLFVLNQRRSGGLAEAVPIVIKFGTTLEQIEGLRNKLLEFVISEKREFQSNILTELRSVTEVHSLTLNVIFFYKSNWQNEGLRLARRNKFICALMVCMQEMGIEGPRMRFPGQKESFPVYMQQLPHMPTPGVGRGGHPDDPAGWHPEGYTEHTDEPFVSPPQSSAGEPALPGRNPSILKSAGRPRKESIAAMNRRVDFSLGMSSIASGDMSGDVFEDRRPRLPINVISPSPDTDYRNRKSESRVRSPDAGRSTSLQRQSTDAESHTSHSTHRNRFFNRNRAHTIQDEQGLMENGMADIPENPNTGSNNTGVNTPADNQRMDPRTGLVSPAAWRTTTDESNVKRPSQEADRATHRFERGISPGLSVASAGINRSATEDFELRRLRS
ncbi:Mechanosensitive ion channel-domain-containing protein [Delphinella strobiligena]|nr:Mechanosensitive ion channel-domain-containing protein [Delphinella strobiligena]